jgi:hypothetical protein
VPALGLFRSYNVRRDVASHERSFKGGRSALSPPTHVHDRTLRVHLMEPCAEVARYEVHLSRGGYNALYDLEALQIRRTGGAAPLARLDVDGLAAGSWVCSS